MVGCQFTNHGLKLSVWNKNSDTKHQGLFSICTLNLLELCLSQSKSPVIFFVNKIMSQSMN